MTIQNPKLTFGIEIELVGFYEDKPILTKSAEERSSNPNADRIIIRGKSDNYPLIVLSELLGGKSDGNWITIRLDVNRDVNSELYPQYQDLLKQASAINQANNLLQKHWLYDWKAKQDPSLTDYEINAIELASKPFSIGDFKSIERLCAIFSDITNIDNSCGLHIHIGMKNIYGQLKEFEYEYLKRFMKSWARIEKEVQKLPFYQKIAEQNWPITEEANLEKIRNVTRLEELIETVNPCGRNYLINLRSLKRHGTIEFRGFKSTLNIKIIKDAVRFCEQRVIDSF